MILPPQIMYEIAPYLASYLVIIPNYKNATVCMRKFRMLPGEIYIGLNLFLG